MIFTLEIPKDWEEPLSRAASEQGIPLENYALDIMQRAVQRERNQASIALSNSFLSETENGEEHAETWQTLKTGLEELRRLTRRER